MLLLLGYSQFAWTVGDLLRLAKLLFFTMWQFATINETLTIVFIFSVSHFLATLRSVYIKLVRYLKLALLLLREHIYASSLSMFEHFKYQSCHIDFINCIKMHCNVRIVVVTLMFLGVVQRSSFSSS